MSYPITAPRVNSQASVTPPLEPKSELKTKEVMQSFIKFTAEQAELLASPKFSALIGGIKMMNEKPTGGFLGNLNNSLGVLLVMASPAVALLKVGFVLPVTVIGALGTAGAAATYGLEQMINKIQDSSSTLDVSVQRKHLTDTFIERMKQILACYPDPEQYALKNQPEDLIYRSVLCTAFLSRKAEEGVLKVGKDDLTLQMLSGHAATVHEYFWLVNEIKEALNRLNLSKQDDEHAWNYLMSSFQNLHDNKLIQFREKVEQHTLNSIMVYTHTFGQLAINDPYFKAAWKENFPEFTGITNG